MIDDSDDGDVHSHKTRCTAPVDAAPAHDAAAAAAAAASYSCLEPRAGCSVLQALLSFHSQVFQGFLLPYGTALRSDRLGLQTLPAALRHIVQEENARFNFELDTQRAVIRRLILACMCVPPPPPPSPPPPPPPPPERWQVLPTLQGNIRSPVCNNVCLSLMCSVEPNGSILSFTAQLSHQTQVYTLEFQQSILLLPLFFSPAPAKYDSVFHFLSANFSSDGKQKLKPVQNSNRK